MDVLFLSPSLHVYTVTNICTNTFQMNHISDMKNQSFPLRKKESKSYILRETRKHTHTHTGICGTKRPCGSTGSLVRNSTCTSCPGL